MYSSIEDVFLDKSIPGQNIPAYNQYVYKIYIKYDLWKFIKFERH